MIAVAGVFVVGVLLVVFLATRALDTHSSRASWGYLAGAVVTVAATATACLAVAQVTLP